MSMYQSSVPVFTQMLGNLSAILDKAAAHAAAKKYDPAVLLGVRLIPDMLPLARQVQIASDHAKRAVARLAGVEPPKYDDNEATLDELKARIAKTLDYIKGFTAGQIDGTEGKEITVVGRVTATYRGEPYLLHYAMPNFFFHVTTAYAILRQAGIEIGKRDYVGPPIGTLPA